jgi:hypothetical protein
MKKHRSAPQGVNGKHERLAGEFCRKGTQSPQRFFKLIDAAKSD